MLPVSITEMSDGFGGLCFVEFFSNHFSNFCYYFIKWVFVLFWLVGIIIITSLQECFTLLCNCCYLHGLLHCLERWINDYYNLGSKSPRISCVSIYSRSRMFGEIEKTCADDHSLFHPSVVWVQPYHLEFDKKNWGNYNPYLRCPTYLDDAGPPYHLKFVKKTEVIIIQKTTLPFNIYIGLKKHSFFTEDKCWENWSLHGVYMGFEKHSFLPMVSAGKIDASYPIYFV